MDYSDVGTEKIPVIATWQFQWNILHENLPTVAQWKIMKRKEEKKKRKINKITKKSQEDGKANNDFIDNAYDNKQLQSTEYR